jgi:hypothetical protein
MIVFVHFPKAAGSSLRTAFQTTYGDRFYLDSQFPGAPEKLGAANEMVRQRLQQRAAEQKESITTNYDIVFGHFRADKYDFLGDSAQRCVVLREPIARLCSEYFYHQATGNFAKRKQEGISLLEFARLPEQVHFYELYLASKPIEDFAFVGLVEYLPLSLEIYRGLFGRTVSVSVENKGSVSDYYQLLRRDNILGEINALQQENIKIYKAGVRRFFRLWESAVIHDGPSAQESSA